MATDEEIREAEQAVVEAARAQSGPPTVNLERALLRLDALKSPLPSRDEFEFWKAEAFKRDTAGVVDVERHWAHALRWVAEQNVNAFSGRGGHERLRAWADELEARSK